MYGFDSMIDMGGEKWKSKAHRKVAIAVCICNPQVHTAEILGHNIGIINKIPNNKIKKVTWDQIREMGCTV